MMERLLFGDQEAEHLLIRPIGEHELGSIEGEVAMIREQTDRDFGVVAFLARDWNLDLSPWEAAPAFGKTPFGGGGEVTLKEILDDCTDPTKTYYLGGYSLAGLFSLWAGCQTDRFAGIAAASPSVWFPGFADYVKENGIQSRHVYLSLGDKEERTKNAMMRTVGEKIRGLHTFLLQQGVDCCLEWNEGNHFRDADKRTARACAWVLGRSENNKM